MVPTFKEMQTRDEDDMEYPEQMEVEVTLFERYERMMKNLNDDNKLSAALKVQIFGPDLKMIVPDAYATQGMIRDMGLIPFWDDLTLHQKARALAEYRLSKMEEVFRRYIDEINKPKKK